MTILVEPKPNTCAVLQENLAGTLSLVRRAAARNSSLPVLNNFLLQADGKDNLWVSATNLEIGIAVNIKCSISSDFAITVPARIFGDFINSLPPERIDMELDRDTQTLNVQCGRFKSNIRGIDAQEFPLVPTKPGDGISVLELDPDVLRTMIRKVAFCAAPDESRPVLAGVLVRFGDGKMTMAAADGFRLAVKSIDVAVPDVATEVIVPANALLELTHVIGPSSEPVQVSIDPGRRQILFTHQGAVLVSQVIEGKYPDYRQIIPDTQYGTRAILSRQDFLEAVKVASLFARNSVNIVKLDIRPGADSSADGRITLMAASQDLGDNVSDLDAVIEGGAVEIAFNTNYLIDALNALPTPQVVLITRSASRPGVLLPTDDSVTYVIMPMHLQK